MKVGKEGREELSFSSRGGGVGMLLALVPPQKPHAIF